MEGSVRAFALCLACLCVTASFAFAAPAPPQALDEVPVGHWSYAAVDALMRQGLVQGYPAAPYTGPAPMTRAEFAGLVARAVRGIGAALQSQGQQLERLAQAPSEAMPEAPAEVPPCPAVTQEDLARIEKLLAEFRNELVTMGANVDKLSAQISDLQKAMAETRKQVDKVAQDIARHRLSGYAQMRYTIDGSATPESQFAVRRAKLAMSGPLSKKTSYKLEFDMPTQSKVGESNLITNQLYAALDFEPGQLLVGQFYLPFGWELFTPARLLEAPEESFGVRRLFADQKYDRGLRFQAGLGGNWQGWLAVVNGTGYRRGDTNDRKDVALRLASVGKSLEYGVSAYFGKNTQPAAGTTPRADANRNLVGAHLMVARGKAGFKGEVITGKAPVADAIAAGAKDVLAWTAMGTYAPCPKTELAVRFHQFDPDLDTADDKTNVTSLVYMRWIDEAVRVRLAEEFIRPAGGANYDIFITELQIVY
jgi:hypothetical protein